MSPTQTLRAHAGLAGADRQPFVDWARGVAYVLMVIAHVAPSDGPGRILLISEFLTAHLFALLIGVGAQLGWSGSPVRGGRHELRELIRAALVFALGLLLARSATSVLIVLMHLAVLMVLCLPLVRLRTGTLTAAGAVTVLCAVAVPAAFRHLNTAENVQAYPGALLRGLALIGGDGVYRLSGLLLCAVCGMLATRWLMGLTTRDWWRGAAAGIVAFTVMFTLIVIPNLLGLYGVHAYDGTPSEQIGVAFGALGVLLLMWALQHSPLGQALPHSVLRLLAAPGQAALTLYAMQILVLHLHQLRNPSERDDHWWMLVLLIALGAGFAAGWQLLLRPLSRRCSRARTWVRGPLEGVVRTVQDLCVPRGHVLPPRGGEHVPR